MTVEMIAGTAGTGTEVGTGADGPGRGRLRWRLFGPVREPVTRVGNSLTRVGT